jgi:hypothetical protein
MGENVPMEEMEGYDVTDDSTDDIQLKRNKYFIDIFNTLSEDVISDEYYDKNEELLGSTVDMLFDINERTGNIPPVTARRVLEGVFSNILKYGLR